MTNSWRRTGRLASAAALFFTLTVASSAAGNADPNVVVVISDVDPQLEAIDKKWIRTNIFKRYTVVDPYDLVDLVQTLQEMGAGEKIDHLHIMGHGNEDGIDFRKGSDPWLTEADFERIKRHFPELPEAFSEHATVEFFHCRIGSNRNFLRTAGEAFLGLRGGEVLASTEEIESTEDSQIYPENQVSVDIPGRQPAKRVPDDQDMSTGACRNKCVDPWESPYGGGCHRWQKVCN